MECFIVKTSGGIYMDLIAMNSRGNFNAVGYYFDGSYYHYIKDHLGNICAVVNSTRDSVIQRTIFYASGVPMAEAYHYLDRAQTILPDEFAHSCYHYGRLLRKKDNPAEAMQAFLAATHSRTHDYHILGRVYSNMGDICHLAGEYNLSYDMFEKSAEMFLKNGDTLLYYYDLNNMAFELAEQGDKLNAYTLLDSISRNCNDNSNVRARIFETKRKFA